MPITKKRFPNYGMAAHCMPGSSTTGSESINLKHDQLGRVFVLPRKKVARRRVQKALPPSTIHFEVYDHHDYTEDKKAAMEGLATLLRTIVE
jgi:hypothetical protein